MLVVWFRNGNNSSWKLSFDCSMVVKKSCNNLKQCHYHNFAEIKPAKEN